MPNSPSDARHTEQIEAHGLQALRLKGGGSEALVYLHGGHVASFRSAEHGELLWSSAHAVYAPGKAIRGGVPICFPWFGGHPTRPELPAHGFARTRAFRFEGSELQGDEVVAELTLADSPETRTLYDHAFRARILIKVGRALEVRFQVENTGTAALAYELALHTYLGVSDVRRVDVQGLERATYDDKVSGRAGCREGDAPLRITGETDRVYDSAARVLVGDPGHKRRVVVEKVASATTVVWNPWIDKAKRMSDFGDDEWPQMLCIEAANTGRHRIQLEPGALHVTGTTISAESL
jgi:glucose-6-phosphate 1-epimerase